MDKGFIKEAKKRFKKFPKWQQLALKTAVKLDFRPEGISKKHWERVKRIVG